jgi:TRAP-type mannitol/chloroaromatic compound transport system substrate-binding protein
VRAGTAGCTLPGAAAGRRAVRSLITNEIMANDERGVASDRVDRRAFLGTAVAGAAAGLAGCSGPGDAAGEGGPAVQTQRNVRWNLASSFPRSLDAIYGAAERLSERVNTLTSGRFQIRAYPAGELVPGLQVMDAVQQGSVQVNHTAAYYFVGKNPVLAFDIGVPFGLTSRLQDAWLYQGGGRELMNEAYADFNIVSFHGGNTGTQMGGWFRREINTMTDLRGLKMRIPGLGAEVMNRLGVTVQVLAGGDIYPALERGAIDATEWVGPYDDEKLGFHNVAQFYYYPGWWEPGPSLTFQVNRQAWDALPSEYQEAFRAAAVEAGLGTQTIYDARNPEAFRRLIEGGTQLRRFSDEIMNAARDTNAAIMEEIAGGDAFYRRVFDEWKTFRDDGVRWFSSAEQAYSSYLFTELPGQNA